MRKECPDSIRGGLSVLDIDWSFLKFRTVVDKVGTRDVKLMLNVELKTWSSGLEPWQHEQIFFQHQLLDQKEKLYSTFVKRDVTVWHFGYFVLRIIGGDRPDKCEALSWNRFGSKGELVERIIPEHTLIDILGFNIDPIDMQPVDIRLRRHHSNEYLVRPKTGVLFEDDEVIVRRS